MIGAEDKQNPDYAEASKEEEQQEKHKMEEQDWDIDSILFEPANEQQIEGDARLLENDAKHQQKFMRDSELNKRKNSLIPKYKALLKT